MGWPGTVTPTQTTKEHGWRRQNPSNYERLELRYQEAASPLPRGPGLNGKKEKAPSPRAAGIQQEQGQGQGWAHLPCLA